MAVRPNIVIDPVTRIEGHLRIQAYAALNGDGKYEITEPGLSASTMVRGVESILKGRDPRDAWAFTQRICGVCTVVHGLTSVRAVEDAIGIKVPRNADYIRNMMIGAQYVHDHVMHFYHLHALDWVDVEKALEADPAKTALLAADNNPNYKPDNGALPNAAYFQGILDKLKAQLRDGRMGGIFSKGYWGHPEYVLDAEANLLLVSHYLEALGWAREVVKLHTVFGGKDPHPNLVVGGMPCTLSDNPGPVSEDRGGTSLNTAGLATIQSVVATMRSFVDQVYFPDVVLVAANYPQWADFGKTAGNFLCFGEFPDPALVKKTPNDRELIDGAIDFPDGYLFPQGVVWEYSPTTLSAFNQTLVTENVAHAWYVGSTTGEHPSVGKTELKYTGPLPDQPPRADGTSAYMLDPTQKYSWIKSPRYNGEPMEVGPLAHIMAMLARAETAKALPTDKLVRAYVEQYWVGALGLTRDQLNSTLGRIFSRMVETKIIADQIAGRAEDVLAGTPAYPGWFQLYYQNRAGRYWNPNTFKRLASPTVAPAFKLGFGFTEAPRGALGHWVKLNATTGMIDNYQCVVASQWNAGPRDAGSTPGPYEEALRGHVLADLARPLEVLRTIHSFDPCIGCAVHIADPNGEPLVQVDVHHALRAVTPLTPGCGCGEAHASPEANSAVG